VAGWFNRLFKLQHDSLWTDAKLRLVKSLINRVLASPPENLAREEKSFRLRLQMSLLQMSLPSAKINKPPVLFREAAGEFVRMQKAFYAV